VGAEMVIAQGAQIQGAGQSASVLHVVTFD
jgi:hypothetical protein